MENQARVAELVDALDLGSSGLVPWEFDSPLSHHITDACQPEICEAVPGWILLAKISLISIAIDLSVQDSHSEKILSSRLFKTKKSRKVF